MARIEVPMTLAQALALQSAARPCFAEMEQLGRVGDTLRVLGVEYRVRQVQVMQLGHVAAQFWRSAGAASPEGFQATWWATHARTGYREHRLVQVHWLEPVAAAAREDG